MANVNKSGDKRGMFSKDRAETKKGLTSISQELKDQLDTYDKIDQIINKTFKVEELSLSAAKSGNKINNKTNKDKLKGNKLDADALNLAKDIIDNHLRQKEQ